MASRVVPRDVLIRCGFKCAISLGGKCAARCDCLEAAGIAILRSAPAPARRSRLRQRFARPVLSLRFAHAQLPRQFRERLRIARRQHARAFRQHFAKRRRVALVELVPPALGARRDRR